MAGKLCMLQWGEMCIATNDGKHECKWIKEGHPSYHICWCEAEKN